MRYDATRLYQTTRKMGPGTIGGQSRVATPVSPDVLFFGSVSAPSVSSEDPSVPSVPCGTWELLGAPFDLDLSATAYSSAFSSDGNSVYFGTNDTYISQRAWSDFTTIIREFDCDPYDGIADWVLSGVAVDSSDFVHTIGWTDNGGGTDRVDIWRWAQSLPSGTWFGIRIWNSQAQGLGTMPSPGAGVMSSIQFSPSDEHIYFHVCDSTLRSRVYKLSADDSGYDEGDATLMWDSDDLGEEGSPDIQLIRTSDNHMMWVSFPGGNPSRFNSLNIETGDVDYIDWNPGAASYVELGLVHAPENPTSIVGMDENSFGGYGDSSGTQILVPSSVASATATDYPELDVATFPEIRSVAISHEGTKGTFWVSRDTVSAGYWYKWSCPGSTLSGSWSIHPLFTSVTGSSFHGIDISPGSVSETGTERDITIGGSTLYVVLPPGDYTGIEVLVDWTVEDAGNGVRVRRTDDAFTVVDENEGITGASLGPFTVDGTFGTVSWQLKTDVVGQTINADNSVLTVSWEDPV